MSWTTTGAIAVAAGCGGATGASDVANVPPNSSRTGIVPATWAGGATCVVSALGTDGVTIADDLITVTVPAAPTLTVYRSPKPLVAGASYTLSWSTANATSLTRSCTAGGSGMTESLKSLALTSSESGVAKAAWVGNDSTCTWTATGASGTKVVTEAVTTVMPGGPTLSLISPQSGSTYLSIGGSAYSVPLQASATTTGGTTLSNLAFYEGGTQLTPSTTGSINTTYAFNEGAHTLTLKGTDSLGTPSTSSTTINVLANRATFVDQSVPGNMEPGKTYSVWIKMRNTGTTSWVVPSGSPAVGHGLGAVNPADNFTWRSSNRVYVTQTVAPQQEYTFNFNVVAPTTPGSYNFQWGMVHEYKEWFSTPSPNVIVNVASTKAASLTSPASSTYFTTGSSYAASVSGTGVASTGASITKLELIRADTSALLLSATTPSSGTISGTYSFPVGTTNVRLHMVDSAGQEAFSDTVAVSVQSDIAEYGTPSVQTAMSAGQTYSVSVPVINRGTTSWTVGQYRLGSLNPADNVIWNATNRVELTKAVAPGEQYTFTFNVKAPATAGSYNFQWGMIKGTSWFAAAAPNQVVSVVAGPLPVIGNFGITPSNVRVAPGQMATITPTGSATQSAGTITKLDLLYSTDAAGSSYVLKQSISGSAATLAWSGSVTFGTGNYRLKLRATSVNGQTESAPLILNVTDSSLLGKITAVRTNDAGTAQLIGWACQDNTAQALTYEVYKNAPPSLNGTLVTQGTANVASEIDNTSVQATCHTAGSPHHFVADLSSLVSTSVGAPLYVVAKDSSGNSIVLPCADNSCTVPGTVRIGLDSPSAGAQVKLPAQAFLQLKITNGTEPYDKVSFYTDEQETVAIRDSAQPGVYYTNQSLAAGTHQLYGMVRQGNTTLFTSTRQFTVLAADIVTLSKPTAQSTSITIGTVVPLSVTATGTAASVKFFVDGAAVGSASNAGGVWTYSWTANAEGSKVVTARAYDASNNQVTESGALNITVSAGTASSATPVAVVMDEPHSGSGFAGTLPGDLAVTPSGSASYSIPIVVPPGTAGLQPQLSLSYDSSAPNGPLGVGWSLGGLSRITRCGQTIAQDGVNKRISFDHADRLCLDGQRLVLTGKIMSDDNYWSDTAVYRTELDSFSRISAQGTETARSFKVEAKDGRIQYYGKDTGRAAALPASLNKVGAQSWALDRVEDRSGNYISIAYSQNGTTGEHLPTGFRYGGKGLKPHAAILIAYGDHNGKDKDENNKEMDRADAWTRYLDETRNDMRRLVNSITTYYGSDLSGGVVTASWNKVRQYSITYKLSNSSGRSLLTKVDVTALRAGTQVEDVLPATVFSWGEPSAATPSFKDRGYWAQGPVLTRVKNANPKYHPEYFAMADFTNDGLSDILEKRSAPAWEADPLYQDPSPVGQLAKTYRYFHNTGSKFTVYSYGISTKESFVVLDIGDYDGDGSPDIIVSTDAAGGYDSTKVCLSPLGKGVGSLTDPITFNCDNSYKAVGANRASGLPYVVDVIGDGRSATYSPINESQSATLCIQTQCLTDWNPPQVLPTTFGNDGSPEFRQSVYTAFTESIDFTGIGKPYDVRWTQPHWTEYIIVDGQPQPAHRWDNLTPTITITGFNLPVTGLPRSTMGAMDYYNYTKYINNAMSARPPYHFDTAEAGGVSGDFSGSGYQGLAFGFIEYAYPNGIDIYNRAEFTLCQSTGRGLNCAVRKKYSGTNYRSVFAVADFIGDGMPGILVQKVNQPTDGSKGPMKTGELEMCRVQGDDTTLGQSDSDSNIVCTATGFNINTAGTNWFVMDLLGTGRPQLVAYESGNGLQAWTADGKWHVYEYVDRAEAGQALDKIHSVTNGLGSVSSVTYFDGAVNQVVKQNTSDNLAYPQHRVSGTGKIVSRISVGNGVAGPRETSFKYEDPAIDVAGRGSLGFAKIVATDVATSISTTTIYRQVWPYTGMVDSVSKQTTAGVELYRLQNTIGLKQVVDATSAQSTYFPYISQADVTSVDLDGSALGTAKTVNIYSDDYGNLTSSTTTTTATGDGGVTETHIAETSTTYFDDKASDWLNGLPKSVKTTRTPSQGAAIARTVEYTYTGAGLLKTETIEPNNDSFKVKTEYERPDESFGLVTSKKQTWKKPGAAAGVADLSRAGSTTYDGNGRYPATVTNAAGQSETHTYDPATGARLSLSDANGLTTAWTVDGFGRVLTETHADGNQIRRYMKACGDCTIQGQTATVAQVTEYFNGSSRVAVPQVVYADSVGHVLRTKTWTFDKKVTVTDQTYDDRGRVSTIYQPAYIDATAVKASAQTYDDLDRVTSVTTSDEAEKPLTSTNAYAGFKVTRTNANSQTRVETSNVLKQLVKVEDALNGVTKFEYEAFGGLSKTTDPRGNVVSVTYDQWGRKTELNDPDLGVVTYSVDPLGRVYSQESANQKKAKQTTAMAYDNLDRMVSRVDADLSAYWTYDTATNGIGLLAEAYTQRADGAKDYQRLHTYDAKGRPSQVTQTLAGVAYKSTRAYDIWGRSITETYQRGSDTAKAFDSRYNDMGYLSQIERGSLVLWKMSDQDAALRTTASVLGNGLKQTRQYSAQTGHLVTGELKTAADVRRLSEGYQYDALGSVTQRTQYWDSEGFTEGFTYDALNRLKTSTVQSGATQTYAYHADGSIKNKTGVGSGDYIYPTQGSASIRPHAVVAIDGIGGFDYDDNGNMVAGLGRTVVWNSFDMPKSIQSATGTSTFVYGAEHQRIRQDRSDGTVTIYAGRQEVETSGGVTTVKTYWPNGIGLEIDKTGSATVLYWNHLDRLGSPVAMTDSAGNLVEKLAYDAWGKRRAVPGLALGTKFIDNKGFTGHEMLDQLGLVHMNGRIYEPTIGKFMSGDPLIQDPTNGQNYNRYSYVLNNPTNLTDPTGFSCTAPIGSLVQSNCTTETVEATQTKENEITLTGKDKNGKVTGTVNVAGKIERNGVYVLNGKNDTSTAKEASANTAPNGGLLTQLKDGYTGDNRSVMWSETGAEQVGRYARNAVDFAVNLLPGSSLPEVGEQAGRGNYGAAAIALGTELLGPLGKEARGVSAAEKISADATRFVDGVKVVDRKTGRVLEGTADLGPTIDRINAGGAHPHVNDGSIFQNRGGVLPQKPGGYYTEYVVPTPGFSGAGPQRIVVGKGGEAYYTPNHYSSFVPLNK